MAVKVAKVVALLELIQEQEPTSANLVSQCLYSELGMGNPEPTVTLALEKLRGLGLLSYSDKLGYKIQSSAGQEWQRERDQYSVIPDAISILVAEKLKSLLGSVTRPQYKNKNFYWAAFYSDGRQRQDERLQSTNDVAVMTVDFRYLTNNEDRNPNTWIPLSSSPNLQNRLIWLVGTAGDLASLVKELAKSRHIIQKYEGRHQTISKDKQRLWFEEQGRGDGLEKDLQNAIAQAFTEGQIFFRGRQIDKSHYGTTFNTILERVGESILPELYSHYIDVAVIPEELKQLLEPNLSGPSHKFMKTGLGILELDAGKYSPTCSGEVPTRIAQYIQDQNGVAGNVLLNYFGGPPYGYPADVVKACLVGLLRGGKVRIRPQAGPEITSVRDPGARDIFEKDREMKRADILPPNETSITPRDRIAICKFFKESPLDVDLDRENDAIADASFQQFPGLVKRLQDIEKRYNKLPSRPELPVVLQKLREALEKCTTSRQVENTVIAVKKYLDALWDGIQQLGIVETDLTDTAVAAVTRAVEIQEHQVKQLRDIESLAEISGAIAALETQLQSDRPWREINSLEPHLQAIEQHYKAVRLQLIERQERQTEEIRDRIKQRPSFNRLNEKQSEYVFRPLQQAAFDTTKDVLYPTLVQLRDSAVIQIQKAEDIANSNLDDLLSKVTEQQVIQLNLELSGREVSTPEEVEALLDHLRERLLTKLKNNTRIRLI